MTDPTRRLAPVVRLAPAKINLTLAVIGRRPDGFHDLHSVVLPLVLADVLSLAVQPRGPDSLAVTGLDAGPTTDNLVLRAIEAARRAAAPYAASRDAMLPLAARLEKRIPVAAGLGGGSSDAAAAIDGALEAWSVEVPGEERVRLAAGVGSDVPLFLVGHGRPVLIEGRGELVAPLTALAGPLPGVLLVTPAVAVATGDVFDVFAGLAGGSGSTRMSSQHLAEELRAGLDGPSLVARAGVLASANDLAPATALVAPALVAYRRSLLRALQRPVGQSGSGPTLWALYPSLDDAEAAAVALRTAHAEGSLIAPGENPPSILATTIAPATTLPERRDA